MNAIKKAHFTCYRTFMRVTCYEVLQKDLGTDILNSHHSHNDGKD